jgi:hypothetical protein
MPNWVYNSLIVSGAPELVEEFKVAVSQPYESRQSESEWDEETKSWIQVPQIKVIESVFSAWNIMRPEGSDLDAYFSVANGSAPSGNWYVWNNTNWGTKWGACEEEIVEDEIYSGIRNLQYRYDTAWSPFNEGFMRIMSEKFPELIFNVEYEEEQGWGGEESWKAGVCFDQSSYDIPSSHADYASRDREGSCACAWLDDPEEWYSDCPKPIDSDESTVVELAATEGEM